MQGFNALNEEVVLGRRPMTTQWAHTHQLNIKPFTIGHVPSWMPMASFVRIKAPQMSYCLTLTILNQARPQGQVFHAVTKNSSLFSFLSLDVLGASDFSAWGPVQLWRHLCHVRWHENKYTSAPTHAGVDMNMCSIYKQAVSYANTQV